MIDFSLTEEQRLLQETARDFAEKEIKPVVREVERREREHIKYTPWDLCQNLVKKGTKLGFTKLLIPEKYGGLGRGCIDFVIPMEELGAADLAIAADYFILTSAVPLLVLAGGNEEQCERLLPEFCSAEVCVLAGAQSEPNVAGSELFCPIADPKLGIKTYAKREGEGYVINGSKSAFISNAGVASAYFILARTDLTKSLFESTSIFYIPANTPGLSIGKNTELIGYKTAHHAEVYLDNVYVPKENLIGKKGEALAIFSKIPQMAIGLAACYVGLARAAYEYALDYAKQRVSWGQPIIKHQAVALKLADMLVDTQAARLLVWDAAYAADTNSPFTSTIKSPAAKTFAVDVAIKNAQNAVKILGGYGVAKEYETARYLSDAWVGYSCDFTRDILRLNMSNFL